MRRPGAGILLGLILLSPATTRADTITLTSVKDNTIYSDFTGNSNALGGGGVVPVGSRFDSGFNAMGGERRGLIAFDIPGSLPAGATINSVSLVLTRNASFIPAGTLGDPTIELHRLLADWGEGTSGSSLGQGAAATTGDATWNRTFFNTVSWTTPGGDFVTAASASLLISNPVSTWTSTQLAADVQGWLDNPTSNFGWALVNVDTRARSVRSFYTHEWAADPSFRPQLIVDYTPASTAVPEPSALALLAAAGGLLAAPSVRRWLGASGS